MSAQDIDSQLVGQRDGYNIHDGLPSTPPHYHFNISQRRVHENLLWLNQTLQDVKGNGDNSTIVVLPVYRRLLS